MHNDTPGIDHTAPFEQRAIAIINWAFGGTHHLRKEVEKDMLPWGARWKLSIHENDLSSFDFSQLTKLVICAHHYAVRVSVQSAGMRLVVVLWERNREGDNMSTRHPDLASVVEWFEQWNAGTLQN